MRHTIPAALAAAALLAGCGGDDTSGAASPKPATGSPSNAIKIAQCRYEPDPVRVKAGTEIAISNADSAPHTLTEKSPSPAFDSGTIRGKGRGSVTFAKPGTFTYFCEFHATMKGTVTVVR